AGRPIVRKAGRPPPDGDRGPRPPAAEGRRGGGGTVEARLPAWAPLLGPRQTAGRVVDGQRHVTQGLGPRLYPPVAGVPPRLRGLAPWRLEPETEWPLAFAPSGLCVAPDGATASAFDARGDDLVRVDLPKGRPGVLARVPGRRPWGLAAT